MAISVLKNRIEKKKKFSSYSARSFTMFGVGKRFQLKFKWSVEVSKTVTSKPCAFCSSTQSCHHRARAWPQAIRQPRLHRGCSLHNGEYLIGLLLLAHQRNEREFLVRLLNRAQLLPFFFFLHFPTQDIISRCTKAKSF